MSKMPPDISLGKRAKVRFQVLDCNVRLESKGLLGRFGGKTHCASLVNLSCGGMQVVCYDILKVKKQYDIAIFAPAFRFPISTKGRVVWQKLYHRKDVNQCNRIGFEFTYFKNSSMEHLEELENNPKLRNMSRG